MLVGGRQAFFGSASEASAVLSRCDGHTLLSFFFLLFFVCCVRRSARESFLPSTALTLDGERLLGVLVVYVGIMMVDLRHCQSF